jgi:WD40 repeat protein
MRILVTFLALALVTGCGPQHPSVVPTPGASPAAGATAPVLAYPITPALFADDDPSEVRTGPYPFLTDGDVDLTFRLDFFADMDAASVTGAIRARAPEAANFRWPIDARSVLFDIPAGMSTFVIDPSGARSANGGGTVVAISWTVERPMGTIVFHDPAALARGDTAPSRTLRLPLNVGGPVHVDRDGRKALVYHRPGHRTAVSVVDLATGQRTALPFEIAKIASNGARFEWLPGGRLLTLGSHDTIVSSASGTDLRWLPALVGQGGPVSPTGDRIALWSYAHNTGAILDIEKGTLMSLGEGYLRCSVNGGVALAWSPDGRVLAISHCTEDMAGSSRTTYVDASTGRTLATRPDSVIAWLRDGSQLVSRWSSASADPRRVADAGLTLLRPDGSARAITSAMPWALSPDGSWLLDAARSPTMQLISLRDGTAHDLPVLGSHVTWIPAGHLAVTLPRTP